MKKITRFALTLLIVHCTLLIEINAQVGINNDNSDPDASAMMDVKSSDKGMLVPRMDSMARNSIIDPAIGLLVYDSTTISFWYYDELQWNEIRNGTQLLTIEDIAGGIEDSCLEQLSNLSSGNQPIAVDIAGNYAYVADRNLDSLSVIDISNPELPVIITNISISPSPLDLMISGNYVFVIADGDETIESIDISDPNNPIVLDSLRLGENRSPYDLAVSEDYAYVVDEDLKIIDISDPNNLSLVGSLDLGMEESPSSVETLGDYVYIVGTDLYELIIVNVSNPMNPFIVSTTFIDDGLEALTLEGNYAYVVGNNFKTVDISDPLHPIISDSLDFSGFSDEVVVSEGYVYVITSSNILLIDIGDPNQAILKSSLSLGNRLSGVAAANGYAYLTNSQTDDFRIVGFCETLIGVDETGALIQTPIAGIDNQTIDVFNLNGNTLQISLEDDAEATQTLDLSSIDTDTDNQTLSFDGTNLSIADGNSVNISSVDTDTDDQTLSFDGTNLSIADGNSVNISSVDTDTDDQTLSFDGTNLSIADGNSVDLSGINSVQSIIEDADGDTQIQVEESADENVIRFDTEGQERWRMTGNNFIPTNAGDGIFIGENAGINDELLMGGFVKTLNIFIGTGAGRTNTSGFTNIGIGASSLELNETGTSNVAVGASALRFNTIGINNVALGHRAASAAKEGSQNVAIGFEALNLQEDGNFNIGIGSNAGGGNIPHSKEGSTYLGYNAGQFNQGNRNVFIGADVASSTNWINVDNTLAIDVEDNSTPLIYGEFNNNLVRINGDLEVTGSFPDTDDQTLAFNTSNNTLSIADGNAVDLSSIDTDTDTDDQTLAFNTSNNTLSIADGNSVDLSSLNSSNPVGTIIMWIGDENESVPAGWLVCNNSTYNTTTYPDLFALLGSNRTPNFLGRFPVGAPRDGINGATGITVGGTGGTEDKTLSVANLPPHSHDIRFREGEENGSSNDYSDINAPANEKNATGSTESTGDGTSFKIMPPFLGVQFLIKAE